MPTTVKNIRVDTELLAWFDDHFSEIGSFPKFVNACLAGLRKEWGDKPSPNDTIRAVVEKVSRERY